MVILKLDTTEFKKYCGLHHKYLKLNCLRPKTICAYSRAIRRIGEYFDYELDDLTAEESLSLFFNSYYFP